MTTWWKPVYSSVVSEIGYDEETKALLVKWKKGKTSAYADVSEDAALACAQAPSVNGYLNDEIKPFFSHRYV